MWPRPRTASNSSAMSSASAVEYYDPRTARSRPTMASSGSGFGNSNPGIPNFSTRSPVMPQPWMAKEASRSSFRSQASSTQITSRTEQSSIRTKGTPVSSLYDDETQDDSIVDDVMGMYYQGFADSDIEGVNEDQDDYGHGEQMHGKSKGKNGDSNSTASSRKASNTIHDHNNYINFRTYGTTRHTRNSHHDDRDLRYYDAPPSSVDSSNQTTLNGEPFSHDNRHARANSGSDASSIRPTSQHQANERRSGGRNITPLEPTPHQITSLGEQRQPMISIATTAAASTTSPTSDSSSPNNSSKNADSNALLPERAPGPRRPRPRSSSVPPNMVMMSASLPKNPELRDSGKSLGLVHNAPAKNTKASSDLKTPLRSPTLLSKTPTINIPLSRAPTPPPPDLQPAPAQVKPEDPLARDRYGFRKENQYITREAYDKWNEGYTQYLARRRKKWNAYMKENGLMTENPTRFPARNAKTKRFVRKGIPPEWRGAAWFYYAGGPAIMAKYSGLYDQLLKEKAKDIDSEAIERDLHRTFPDNIKFRPNGISALSNTAEIQKHMVGDKAANSNVETPIISALRRVLLAFAVHNPAIGYCQSLNFLAGLLLLFIDSEEHCFWLLNVITRFYLPGTHETSLEGSKVDLAVMMSCLCETIPDLFHKLAAEPDDDIMRPAAAVVVERARAARKARPKKRDPNSVLGDRLPPITLFMTSWFMNCFIGVLPIETTLRVWDVFFCEGSKTFFRIAMTIFRTGETQIRTADPMEIFPVVQGLPRRLIDANAILELCFRRRGGFNHVSQQMVDERRAEARRLGEVERRKQAEAEAEPKPTQAKSALPFGGPRRRQGTHV
ncbi:GTPase-activating protein gyp3 [Ceratocystis platani]|uniref:GTPase-activating protein gyp3 n=1 Tax=Ceratocystis fimbriata f. sp. platani TaxID=88771 RepID=A0A0F8BKQ1_CERFI|nr:GTPase-activating protein gyp3 [Ceratocystis platani]